MGGQIADLLILLGIIAIAVIAAWFVLSQMTLPEPIRKIVIIVLVIIVAVLAIIMLLNLRGGKLVRGDSVVPHQVVKMQDVPRIVRRE